MIKKSVIAVLVLFMINCFFVIGISVKDYTPGWFKDYGGNQSGVLYNFWHSLNPFIPAKGEVHPYDNADVYGWYNGSFFGLAEWEREVCLIDLSTDVMNIRNVVAGDTDDEWNIYTTTVTVAATRQKSFNNSYLYEVSWYIFPYGNDALYRVYLKRGNKKEYFAGKPDAGDGNWETATQYVGDSGYDAAYFDEKYNKVVLEYRDYGSPAVNDMVVSVVEK